MSDAVRNDCPINVHLSKLSIEYFLMRVLSNGTVCVITEDSSFSCERNLKV